MSGTDDIVNLIAQADAQNNQPASEGTPSEPTPAPAQQVEDSAGTPDNNDPQVVVSTQTDKDVNAFAEMRVQNKVMADTLKKIADATGIKYTSQDEMLSALNTDAIEKLATQKGVPVEFLKRMEMLEANAHKWEEQQTQQRLQQGFSTIQQKYGLSQQDMMTFAKQLDEERVDLNTLDVEKEYVARNLESIVNARVQAAVQEALKRDAQAGAQSTTPGASGTSNNASADVSVKSSRDLLALLANMPGFNK